MTVCLCIYEPIWPKKVNTKYCSSYFFCKDIFFIMYSIHLPNLHDIEDFQRDYQWHLCIHQIPSAMHPQLFCLECFETIGFVSAQGSIQQQTGGHPYQSICLTGGFASAVSSLHEQPLRDRHIPHVCMPFSCFAMTATEFVLKLILDLIIKTQLVWCLPMLRRLCSHFFK